VLSYAVLCCAKQYLRIERFGIGGGRRETDERASEEGVPRGVGGGGRRPHL
jgi:hypothetical protein